MTISLPRGTSDFKPEEAITLKAIKKKIEHVYRLYGFYPLETPALELLETLTSKAYGEENEKEIYVIDGKIEGLRYDLTVPLARYISMNKDIVLPFKRYQIGAVWRMDEPQKMRDREFFQADMDIVGNTNITAEAELLSATMSALSSIGITSASILINSRVLLGSIMDHFGINGELHIPIMRIIDKLQKIGKEETKKQIIQKGINDNTATELLDLILSDTGNAEKLSKLENMLGESKAEIEKLMTLLSLLKKYGIDKEIIIDLSLARGMEYYTGLIWEVVLIENGKRLPSIASGGRYDKLIGKYLKRDIPAVGSSIGINRVFQILDKNNTRTYAKAYVAYINKENQEYAISIGIALRKNNISTDINLLERGITKQLDYANALKIPYVIIVGSIERTSNKLKLRNMSTGEEQMLDLESSIKFLKENIENINKNK